MFRRTFQLVTLWLLVFGGGLACGQNSPLTGYCEKGATPSITSGLNSINTLQGIVPGGPAGCTVTVYLSGTTTPATIYSNASGGTLNNPFQASLSGQWLFFAASGVYDVVLSGGIPPNSYITPVTLTGLTVSGALQSPLNGIYYVNPSASTDLITQINNLFAACGNNCEVHIPAGTYMVNGGTANLHHSSTKLIGDGKNLVKIIYNGAGPAIDQRNSGSDYDVNFDQGGEIAGFTITCTNSALTSCVSIGSVLADDVHDITVIGPGGIVSAGTNAGDGILFQNSYAWMERANFRGINLGGFTHNLHFANPDGGTDSFGYGWWDFSMNVSAGTNGVLIDNGASVYNTRAFTLNVNNYAGSYSDYIFNIAGAFTGTSLHETGEGGVIGLAYVSGNFVFSGDTFTFSGNGFGGSGYHCLGPYCTPSPLILNYSSSGTIANYGWNAGATVNVYTDEVASGPLGYAPTDVSGHSWLRSTTPSYTGAFPTSQLWTHDTTLPMCWGSITGGSQSQPQTNVALDMCISASGLKLNGALDINLSAASFDDNGRVLTVHGFEGAQATYGADHINITTANNQSMMYTFIGEYPFGPHGHWISSNGTNWYDGVNGPSATSAVNDYVVTNDPSFVQPPQLAVTPAGIAVPSISIAGGTPIGAANAIPVVGSPTVNQAACIKASGPPVVIGYCSTVVSSTGSCTCN